MSESTLVRTLLVSAVCLLLTSFALAQYNASLEGTVTDKTGAVVAGASVTITEQATGITHAAVSGAAGFYRVTGLPPGKYKIEVGASNFKKSTRSDVDVNAETANAANVVLE